MKIDCYKCEYYYVTWEKNFPHGCRAMGFKGKELPNITVRKSTGGKDCISFKMKILRREKNKTS